jgi:hypothetical protein
MKRILLILFYTFPVLLFLFFIIQELINNGIDWSHPVLIFIYYFGTGIVAGILSDSKNKVVGKIGSIVMMILTLPVILTFVVAGLGILLAILISPFTDYVPNLHFYFLFFEVNMDSGFVRIAIIILDLYLIYLITKNGASISKSIFSWISERFKRISHKK